MAILTLGIAVVTNYSLEKEILLAKGDSYQIEELDVSFDSIEDSVGPNYLSKLAKVSFTEGSSTKQVITEKRTYFPSGQPTTEAGIETQVFKDLYVSMGDNLESDIWSFKVQVKPFIRWIWLGALLIAIGTIISGVRLTRKL